MAPGRYRPVGILGQGGMGTVYQVEEISTGRHLALKRLAEPSAEQDRFRFRREFHTLAQLQHPSIVEVHEFGSDAEGLYYTMELLEGVDLHEMGLLPMERSLTILLQISGALAFLHARRLVHRDVATRNIRLGAGGRAKLFDFGILATEGATAEVAGTPPYVAPECYRGLPLDHRADLFALGALAYRLLTGQHAYPAQRFDQLEAVWTRRILPPSAFQPAVPEPLDALVMSLLSLDPTRRPRNAAEVIDRMGGLADRAAAAQEEAARAYLAAPPLVGRHQEMDRLRRWLESALSGQLEAVVLESTPGLGKTRLLGELALEAQLAGALVLRADGDEPVDAPYATIRRLLRHLFRAAPELASRTGAAHAALVRVLPELAAQLGRPPMPRALEDPNEERARVQEELIEWFLEISRVRPLVLLLDNAHHCDEASATVLAMLGMRPERRPLLVAVGLRGDVTPRAPGPIAALRRHANALRLRGLDLPQLLALLRGTFGDQPRLERLAAWVHRISAGNPLHTMHLSRHLVERGTLRYQDGRWEIPELSEGEVPPELLEALSDQLRSLSLDARVLAEALSVHHGELPVELCVKVSGLETEKQAFHAIDELVRKEVLAEAGGRVRFLHGGFQEALVQGMPEERRRRLHRRLGEVLLAAPGAGDRDGEIGWNLLMGGDEARAAERLERVGRTLYGAQAMKECVAPLEAALQVHERLGKSPRQLLELRFMLLVAGSIADMPVGLRQVEPLLDGHAKWAGLDGAPATRPLTGMALAGRLLRASGRWLLTPGSRCGPPPMNALVHYALTLSSAVTMAALLHHEDALREHVARVDRLPPGIPGARALSLYVHSLLDLIAGSFQQVRVGAAELLALNRASRQPGIPPLQKRIVEAAMRLQSANASLSLGDTDAFQVEVAATEKVDLRMFDGHVALSRSHHHRIRGEEQQALEHDAVAERSFLRIGAVWGAEVQQALTSSLSYAVTRDVLGMRRAMEELDRLNARGAGYQALQEAIRGEYHRERGELDLALGALERARSLVRPTIRPIHQTILVAIAETQLALGLHAQARHAAEEACLACQGLGHDYFANWVKAERVMGLALAAGGEVAAGAARLDRALEAVARLDQPAAVGSLHEARALVALMQEDTAGHLRHATRMEELFAPTRNPVLLARSQRVLRAGRGAQAPSGAELAAEAVTVLERPPTEVTLRSAVLWGARGTTGRLERALELLVWEAAGARGFLFLVRNGRLILAVPAHGDEPATEISQELGRRVTRPDSSGETELSLPDGGRWLPVVLAVRGAAGMKAVAAAAILGGRLSLRPIPESLRLQIGEELWQAGDATAMP